MGVPALYVVGFTDSLLYIAWSDIDGNAMSIAGCAGVVKSQSDVEPVIEVPIASMRPVGEKV